MLCVRLVVLISNHTSEQTVQESATALFRIDLLDIALSALQLGMSHEVSGHSSQSRNE